MDSNETRERIERLRAHCNSAYDVMTAFMDGNSRIDHDCDKFKAALIALLERSDPDDWTDEQLRECGLIRLPKDADGVPVCIEDTVYDSDGESWTVGDILLSDVDDAMLICESSKGSQRTCGPMFLTHHPPVTVESLLQSFFAEAYGASCAGEKPIPNKTIAYFAERLRLAEVDE